MVSDKVLFEIVIYDIGGVFEFFFKFKVFLEILGVVTVE